MQAKAQFRFYNLFGDYDQWLLRLGANYKLDKDGNYEAGIGVDNWYNESYIGNTDEKFSFTSFVFMNN